MAIAWAVILFDVMDRLIFPLRMRLFAPPQTRIQLTTLADGGSADWTGNAQFLLVREFASFHRIRIPKNPTKTVPFWIGVGFR
jgi:hypothetical protein